MRHSPLRTLCLCSLALAATPSQARAGQDGGDEPAGLISELGGPEWKWTAYELKKHFETALWDQYKAEKKSLPGPLEIDRLREKTLRRVQRMKAKFVRFERGTQHYRVSIIDEDFKRGSDEAMLHRMVEEGQQYWFFVQDQFWKIVIAYNTAAIDGRNLKAFAKELRGRFGKPVDLVFEEVKGKDALMAVKWADEHTEIVLRDRTDPYDTFTLTYTHRPIAGRIQELRGEVEGLGGSAADAEKSAMLDDIMTASETDEEAGVVDEIIGATPKKKAPEAAPKPGPTKAADADIDLDSVLKSGQEDAADDGEIIY